MKYLLDTHTFLWFIEDSTLLKKTAKTILESDHDLLLSVASIWEIAIKVNLGKLQLAASFDPFIPEQIAINDLEILSIQIAHLNLISSLPLHHRDPFDRLLIAQAITEQIPVISRDTAFDAYQVTRIW